MREWLKHHGWGADKEYEPMSDTGDSAGWPYRVGDSDDPKPPMTTIEQAIERLRRQSKLEWNMVAVELADLRAILAERDRLRNMVWKLDDALADVGFGTPLTDEELKLLGNRPPPRKDG